MTNQVEKLRFLFQKYFEEKKHYYLEPVSIVASKDPSLLWVNSGVATLKDFFLGLKTPPDQKLVNTQPSLRTVDLENIGKTNRHLTLFTMLGHFSIGDYGKKAALIFAYEFLISKNYCGLDVNRLYITVFKDDLVAYDILTNDLGIMHDHIIKNGRDLNFWDMKIGPCGPNVEFYYDLGQKYDPKNLGLDILRYDYDCDRFLEVWNCVFSEFNNLGNDVYEPLTQKNIDTGAGLERLAMLIQNVDSVYELDIFQLCYQKISKMIERPWKTFSSHQKNDAYIIADHMRAILLALFYKIIPGNNGRNYVIRRLLRRLCIILYKHNWHFNLSRLIEESLISLRFIDKKIDQELLFYKNVLDAEQNAFKKTLDHGKALVANYLQNNHSIIDTKQAFYFYETHGLALEIVQYFAKNHLNVDLKLYQELMNQHRSLSSQSHQFKNALDLQSSLLKKLNCPTKFLGYEVNVCKSPVKYLLDQDFNLLKNNHFRNVRYIITQETVFYATGGGQMHDTGTIKNDHFSCKVVDVQKIYHNHYFHKVSDLKGQIQVNEEVILKIDVARRKKVMQLHTATHLLNAAINKVLMNKKYEIKQTGSAIYPEYMRFDFLYEKNISLEQLQAISDYVNQKIKTKTKANVFYTTLDKAKALGACMLDEDKYEAKVRVVEYKNISIELCGGTHVHNLEEIEKIFIKNLENKGKNLYRATVINQKQRIEDYLQSQKLEQLNLLEQKLVDTFYEKIFANEILALKNENLFNETSLIVFKQKITALIKNITSHQKENTKKLQQQKTQKVLDNLKPLFVDNDKKFYFLEDLDQKLCRTFIDVLAKQDQEALFFVFLKQKGDHSLIFLKSFNQSKYNCKNILNKIFTTYKGHGGGKNTFAQGSITFEKSLSASDIFQDLLKIQYYE